MCLISGMMISRAASVTAFVDPGMQKTARPPMTPAIARERMAAVPISS